MYRHTEQVDGHMAFTPEEVEQKLHHKLIDLLIERGDQFRVSSDGYCTIVDYVGRVRVEDGDRFELITSDEYIGNYDDEGLPSKDEDIRY